MIARTNFRTLSVRESWKISCGFIFAHLPQDFKKFGTNFHAFSRKLFSKEGLKYNFFRMLSLGNFRADKRAPATKQGSPLDIFMIWGHQNMFCRWSVAIYFILHGLAQDSSHTSNRSTSVPTWIGCCEIVDRNDLVPWEKVKCHRWFNKCTVYSMYPYKHLYEQNLHFLR